MLTEEQISSLKEVLNTKSPSGCEFQATEWIRKQIQNCCRAEKDSIGNLYLYTGNEEVDCLTVMITAHADEVGFQITDIDEDGYVYVRKVSGLDPQTIPGTAVVAISESGEVKGVFGKKTGHVQNFKEREKVPELEDLWVDFGFESKEEALKYLNYGDYLTASPYTFISKNKQRVIAKALDNKIGLFILSEVIKQISRKKLSIKVVGVATTQEELGCRGSKVAANRIKPDIAFCIDVGIATDTPKMSPQKYGRFELGKGVGLIRNADNNDTLVHSLAELAEVHKIQYQYTVGFLPTGGTESSAVQLAICGIPTANISIPNRYMHSMVEMCDLRDVASAIELLVQEIQSLGNCPTGVSKCK